VAVRLQDGRVLVAGGVDDVRHGPLSSAALFDPGTGVTATASMSVPRSRPAATVLGDGSVLVAGGDGNETSADRYLPTLGRWIPASRLTSPRWGHTATLLRDGRVLVTGGAMATGCCERTALSSTEIYNPVSNTWTPGRSMGTVRYSHTATLLADGRVLVVGGNGGLPPRTQLASAEIYDPSTDAWTPISDMSVARVEHTATALPDGKVLVAGGANEDTYWFTSEVFDPKTGRWSRTGDMAAPRAGHTATAWGDARILVAGGLSQYSHPLATAEIYDPDTGQWDKAVSMKAPRYLHTATLLSDGKRIAFIGGWNGQTGATGDVALYQR
jgi:N-acetylneuraminic acid mutarotase